MRFTIVTPSYNQLDWLRLCVASVADQVGAGREHTAYGIRQTDEWSDELRVASGQREAETGDRRPETGNGRVIDAGTAEISIEHIVCDAGSEGIEGFKTRMLERFSETPHYRLEFVIGPDAGMYDAINKGLLRATGEICSYLNCDEQYLPGGLAAVADYFRKHAATDVLFGDTIVVGQEGEPLCYWRPYVPTLKHLAGSTLNTLTCSTFFRRRVVEAGHLFEPQWKVVGDLQWIRGLLEKERPMVCVPRPLAAFTFLGDNLGASAKAHEEFGASREASSGLQRAMRRVWHGLRKLFSGAYVRRNVSYDLFTLSEPSRRRRYTCPSLGWKWPGLAKNR